MKKIGYAVIGAGFGDEGKGLMTDFLARKFTNDQGVPVNVRCNGGAQAGHTVVDGSDRHVFGHFGAATFAGASTFLSSKFIFNPFAFKKEYAVLRNTKARLLVDAHPDCEVTTVFDMVLNGLQELSRGDYRHGSCGLGINETITRQLAGHSLKVSDLSSKELDQKIHDMWYNWFFPRYKSIDLSSADKSKVNDLFGLLLWRNGAEVENLRGYKLPIDVSSHPTNDYARPDVFIFEGAQGLQLDEFLGVFPHVTRSITGLPSAMLAAYELGVTEITPLYITRAYKTRHGAGPLSHEREQICNLLLHDQTNITGQWQGQFRYAPLDLAELKIFIGRDLERSRELSNLLNIQVKPTRLAVTCLDQVGDTVFWYGENGNRFSGPPDSLLDHLDNIALVDYISYGPSAAEVSEHRQ